MTLRLVRPAPLIPLVEMLAREDMPSGLTPQLVARVQNAVGKSWGFVRDDAAVVACAGLMPYGEHEREAWFACSPDLAPHMLAFVRLAQLTLAHATDDASVTTRVEPGWTPGEKLAHALGFTRAEQPGLWIWNG